MVLLTEQFLKELQPMYKTAKEISVKSKEIDRVCDLSECKSLYRLVLSDNILQLPDCLKGIYSCRTISFLNLSQNNISTLKGLEALEMLQVLNLSHNQISGLEFVSKSYKLKALILNNNKLSKIEYLDGLKDLNTLIVSHNQLENVTVYPKLLKLSAAHNKIKEIPEFPSECQLKELRLNDNRIVSFNEIPETLEILDLGNNQLKQFSARSSRLHNLNLKGNELNSDQIEQVMNESTGLRVLNGDRFDVKFLERKSKRRAIERKRSRAASAVTPFTLVKGTRKEASIDVPVKVPSTVPFTNSSDVKETTAGTDVKETVAGTDAPAVDAPDGIAKVVQLNVKRKAATPQLLLEQPKILAWD